MKTTRYSCSTIICVYWIFCALDLFLDVFFDYKKISNTQFKMFISFSELLRKLRKLFLRKWYIIRRIYWPKIFKLSTWWCQRIWYYINISTIWYYRNTPKAVYPNRHYYNHTLYLKATQNVTCCTEYILFSWNQRCI